MEASTKRLRGFAVLKARGEDITAIASKGGKSAHAKGLAHKFTSEEAREAGRKGGLKTQEKVRAAKAVEVAQ